MKMLATCLFAIALAGCQTPVKDVEVKEVKVPVYIFPKPPAIAPVVTKVSTLVEADKKDPGKVAQAYKHDHIVLTGQIKEMSAFIGHLNDLSANQGSNPIDPVAK